MLKTENVKKLIKSNKNAMHFDQIWDELKENLIKSQTHGDSESTIKTNLYMSMMEEQGLIMIGSNTWDLKEKYSQSEQKSIEKSRMTIETELNLEETDDTRELKLEIIREIEE